MHTEVPVRVNAWVDAGVAPLVKSLNEIDNILTLDSCEGEMEHHTYVYFTHREGTEPLIQLVRILSTELGASIKSCCGVRLRLEWTAGTELPIAGLLIEPELVPEVSYAISKISRHMSKS